MGTASLERNTLIGLGASVVLAAGKFVAGVVGHSSALIADAVESLADTIGSIIVWRSLRVADRPADAAHPYGYGKAEALAALCVGALLLIAAAFIVIKASGDMLTPHQAPEAWTLLVLVGVIVVKEGLFRLVLKGAEIEASDAARADAWHHRADAITSAAAVIGVSLAIWGPRVFGVDRLVLADEAAAMVASGIIVMTGVRLMKPSLRELLDAASPELAEQVRATAASVGGVELVEKVEARKSGRGYLVDMHVHVDPHMSVQAAHGLAGVVKAHVKALHPKVRRVLIHVEPGQAAEQGASAPPDVAAQAST
jgi:cation diffusion facilitator family transporter